MSTGTPTPEVEAVEREDGIEGSKATAQHLQEQRRGAMIVRVSLLALCLLWTVPTIGLLMSSFRTRSEVVSSGWWTVLGSPLEFTQFTLDNYDSVLFGSGMANAFINTAVVTIPATVIPIMVAAFAAYAFSWMRFPGREVIFVIFVGLLVVPMHIAFIPLLRVFGAFNITGTFLSVWLAHTGFGMPLAVYLMRNYMGSLPNEVIESARVDGASDFQVFWRLVLPLSTPVLAAFAIFQFLWVWNDFLVALVFLGGLPDVQVLTVNLAELIGQRGQDWHLLTAGAFVTMTVPLIVFFTLQRYFVRGMTAGSVKG
ncbi:carbohydrate ABC transporter permease [Nitriliruptor alkaliphilus]|uniref:carbohydrate ABC transporter permease n=1 Tax=Nitriliruptor alkaliphilus TaxID=427918 RepID=UPI0009FB4364|nr:carbohydrate ABC transporter permease [Nitriliruptor alkaliphilus]